METGIPVNFHWKVEIPETFSGGKVSDKNGFPAGTFCQKNFRQKNLSEKFSSGKFSGGILFQVEIFLWKFLLERRFPGAFSAGKIKKIPAIFGQIQNRIFGGNSSQ